MRNRSVLLALTLGALLGLTGCANLEAVGKFGASGAEVSKAYRPLVDQYLEDCRENEIVPRLDRDGPYDLREEVSTARATCAGSEQQKAVALRFPTVVEGYSNSLVSLAGLPNDYFAADIDAMNGVVKALKIGDPTGPPLVNGVYADAITTLTKLAAEAFVARKVDSTARRAIQEGNEPLKTLVNAMRFFVGRIAQVEAEKVRDADQRAFDKLVKASDAPLIAGNSPATIAGVQRAIPFRLEQQRYFPKLEAAAQRKGFADAFDAAALELLRTSDDLAANYDKLTAAGRADTVKQLIAKVQILRKLSKTFEQESTP
ncbi:hypothetical protein ACSFA0_22815 [Variovorax sp. LT1P1]|uniref:hypothetical protein n=1 Tax=Variovorax sp. LT1P1 TaxID=3443730 RepID=UPI003F46A0A1